ncbi:hypothetical protein ACFV4P_34745 [Kitasatospora sp. NPDC059795]|uniref:hypothetical protein n=1 Tax=Kitasatospora sp. NPDC059795 TaxID=3346949 RepID=UPI0036624C87
MIQLRRTEPGTLSRQLLWEAQQLTSDPGTSEEDRALVVELTAQYRAEAEWLLGALKKAGREGGTRTWGFLADRTRIKRLLQLGHLAKVEVLVIAESRAPAGQPLWSVGRGSAESWD